MALSVVSFTDIFVEEDNKKVFKGRALLDEFNDTGNFKTLKPGDTAVDSGAYWKSATTLEFVAATPFTAELQVTTDHNFNSSTMALHDENENIYYPMFLSDLVHMLTKTTIDHGRVSGVFGYVKKNRKFGIQYLSDS